MDDKDKPSRADLLDIVDASINSSILVELYLLAEFRDAIKGSRKVEPLDSSLQVLFSETAAVLMLDGKCFCPKCLLDEVNNEIFASAAAGVVDEESMYLLTDQTARIDAGDECWLELEDD